MSDVKLDIYGNPIKGAREGAEKSVIEACLKVMSQAKKLAPKDTGRLRDSISYKTTTSSEGDLDVNPKEYEGYVGTNVGYGIYQEFGTRKMVAQPFLRPAIGILKLKDIDIITAIQKAMIDSVKKGVKSV